MSTEVDTLSLVSVPGAHPLQPTPGHVSGFPAPPHSNDILPISAREKADLVTHDQNHEATLALWVEDKGPRADAKEERYSAEAIDLEAVGRAHSREEGLKNSPPTHRSRPPSMGSEVHIPSPRWTPRPSRSRSPSPLASGNEPLRPDRIYPQPWRGVSEPWTAEEEKAHKFEWIEPAPDKSDDAQIWRIYVEKANEYDKVLIERWNDGIGVFLLFTGLFSAILSAFLIASWSTLQPDNSQATVDGLVALSQQLVLLSSGVTMDSSHAYQPTQFVASWWAVTVNGLWFTSLFISLLAAIVAMLIKEWLSAYNENVAVVPIDRVKQRQFRYDGIEKWMLPTIVSILPLSIHLAVFLFFLGLVFFAWPVSTALFCLMLIILGAGVSLYFISAIAPLKYPECPYKSPLFGALQVVHQYLRATRQRIRARHDALPRSGSPSALPNLEAEALKTNSTVLQAKAVTWLAQSPNPTIQELAVHFLSWWRMTPSAWNVVQKDVEEAAAHFVEARILSSARQPGVPTEELLERLALASVLPVSEFSRPRRLETESKLHILGVRENLKMLQQRAIGSFRQNLLIISIWRNMDRDVWKNVDRDFEIKPGRHAHFRRFILLARAKEQERWPSREHEPSREPETSVVDVSHYVRLEMCLGRLHSRQGVVGQIVHDLGDWTYHHGLDGKTPPAFNFLFICILGHLLEVQPLPCCSCKSGEWEYRYPTDLSLLEVPIVQCLERLVSTQATLPSYWSERYHSGEHLLVRQLLMKYIAQNPSLLGEKTAATVIAELDGWTGTGENTDRRAGSELLIALLQHQPSIMLESILPSLRYWIKTNNEPRLFRSIIERCNTDMENPILLQEWSWSRVDPAAARFIKEGYMKQYLRWIQDSTSYLWPMAISIAWAALPHRSSGKSVDFFKHLVSSGWLERMVTDGVVYVLSYSNTSANTEIGVRSPRLARRLEDVALCLAKHGSTLSTRMQALEVLKKLGSKSANMAVEGDGFPPDEPDEVGHQGSRTDED